MIKRTLLLAMALLPLSSHAQVYKCEVDGSTAYQDTPCTDGEVFITRDTLTSLEAQAHAQADPAPAPAPAPARQPRRQHSSQPRQPSSTSSYRSELEARNARVKAGIRGEIVEGMTKGQLYMMLGEPDHERKYTRSDGKRCEYWSWSEPRFVPKDIYQATICDEKVITHN